MLKTSTETGGEGTLSSPLSHGSPLKPMRRKGCSSIFHALHKTNGAIEFANPSDRAKHKNVRAVPEWLSDCWLAPAVVAAVDRWTAWWWLLPLLPAEAADAPLLWMKMFFEAFDALDLFAEAVDALELLSEAVETSVSAPC